MTDSTAGEGPADGRRAPWRRDFNLLWSASAANQLGSTNAMLAVPLLALSLTGSPVFAGWVTAAGTLPRILLALPVGALVDYMDRRRVMIVSLLARGVLAVLLTAGAFATMPEHVVLPLVAAAQGVCLVFFSTAEATVVPRLVPREHLPGAMAKNEARVHAAALLGRPLGGLLFDLHRALAFAVDALTSFLSVFALLRMAKDRLTPHGVPPRPRVRALVADLGDGFAYLRRERFLVPVLVVCALANFFFQTLALVLILLAHQQRLPSLLIGCLIAATGFGGVLGSFTASRLQSKGRTRGVIVTCVWSWLMLTGFVALVDHDSVVFVAVVLPLAWGGIGFTGAHINVALAVYQADEVPKELLGRVTGAGRFLSGGAVPLGALSAGYLIAVWGTRGALVAVAVAIGLLAVVLTLMVTSLGHDLGRLWRAAVSRRGRRARKGAARAGRPPRSERAAPAAGPPRPPPRPQQDLIPNGRARTPW
ncbi:MFS transporter [Actinomadura sp. ATCC 39365]|uniref:MFS transporter n=1 Tax=Nonomuraea sp. NPDC005692 TaxID=3157168 RepID=UPI0033C2EA1A